MSVISIISETTWQALLTFGAALIGWLTARYGKSVANKQKHRKEHIDVVKGIEKLNTVYRIMVEIQELGAPRVIMFAGHNGGGLPRPGCGYWVSAIHWAHLSGKHKATNRTILDYRNIPVDMDYISMLLEAERRGCVEMKTDRMPACLLKDYYEAEGVSHSVVLFIGIREGKFLFISAARFDGYFSGEDVIAMKLKANRISQLI